MHEPDFKSWVFRPYPYPLWGMKNLGRNSTSQGVGRDIGILPSLI